MSEPPTQPKHATDFTRAANTLVRDKLPFDDESAYEDVRRGLIVEVPDLQICAGDQIIWSLRDYQNQMSYPPPRCPHTVNPSLWRQANLNSIGGLFKVTDGIYQVRAYDMSNLTIIEGDTGLILIDPLISMECAAAALQLYRSNVAGGSARQVRAVIHTHSHVDHFGGVAGVVSAVELAAGRVEIIAPSGFLEHAVSENVYAGVAMGRRAQYMYGPYLPSGNRGQVDAGLGKGQSTGTISLIAPTITIERTGQEIEIDGVQIIFQLTPGTEAPAEMNFYFPRFRAMCAAENATHNMHNIQTLRGALVRDALAWSKYLNETLSMFGDETQVLFAQHHWPVWGQHNIRSYLRHQRDLYRYLNDQTLRLLNRGYTGVEIAETFTLPTALDQKFDLRGYYGSVSHNVKAIYHRYMGWFDGNPATLHSLPPVEAAPRYVAAMGGEDEVMKLAQAAFDRGEYRWAAQLLQHLVFANPDSQPAMELQADAFEQLGYQAENATWRNFYLMGAQELRAHGVVVSQRAQDSAAMIEQLTLDMVFDMLGARLDGLQAAAEDRVMNWSFVDTGEQYLVEVSSGALSHTADRQALGADVVVLLARSTLNALLLGQLTFRTAIEQGLLDVPHGLPVLLRLFSMLDDGDSTFPIITPREPELPDMGGERSASAESDVVLLDRHWRIVPPILKGC